MRHILRAALPILAAACLPALASAQAVAPVATEAPAGAYEVDLSHASLIFRVDHLGLSMYTARFTRFTAALAFDPARPEASSVTVTVDPNSLQTDFPTPDKLDFDAMLRGPKWLDAAQFPEMTYRSTRVELTGPNTARIVGDLTLHGATHEVVLDARFNGGYAGHAMEPNARIGFSARGVLNRSDYGIAYGIPQPGSKMGVGDEVEVLIEAEFTGPPTPQASPTP